MKLKWGPLHKIRTKHLYWSLNQQSFVFGVSVTDSKGIYLLYIRSLPVSYKSFMGMNVGILEKSVDEAQLAMINFGKNTLHNKNACN